MSKKNKWMALSLVATIGINGCGVIQLTDEQNAQAAEYIAGVLLKHSSNYDKSLVYVVEDETPLPETTVMPEATTAPSDKEEGSKSESSIKEDKQKINDVYNIDGLKVSCVSATECSEYTENGNMSYGVYAKEGKKLVVVKFSIKNTSSSAKKINLINKNVVYQLNYGNNTSVNSQITLLSNDMNFLSTSIKKGKTQQGVVVFEVPSKAKLENLQIKVTKGTISAIEDIK